MTKQPAVTNPAITHGSFTIERTYDVAPAKVFAAFKDPAAKRRWYVEGEGFTVESYEPGFGVGAFERSSFRFKGGPLITNDTVYLDAVEGQRLIFAYSMALEGKPMSSSLVTIQFEAKGHGTQLTFTEQGAYMEGFDDIAGREHGSRGLLEALARDLAQRAA